VQSNVTNTLGRVVLSAAMLMLIWNCSAVLARAQDLPSAAAAQAQASTEQQLPEGQLEQLVAPIALYPDPLLSQILMASTYPPEVVEAARWSQDNSMVKGHALQDAMQGQSWDPSVKALTAVPQTLLMMSDKLDWTQQLGDAFLAQQQGVLAAVQSLRAEAQATGNLQSTPQQVVTLAPAPADVAVSGMGQAITIEPVNPDVYYVPVYDPAVVYGAWDYPSYPPFYWSPPGFVASNVVSFGAGVAVGAAIWGGCDWWHQNVTINVNRFNAFNHANINIANNIWTHDPAHRGDVPYRNASVAARFGGANNAAPREGFRERVAAHDDVFRDRADTQRPDAVHGMAGESGDAARRIAPALAERPDGDLDRRPDRAIPERQEFARPRGRARPQAMRPRAQAFRPERRAFGGGFHFGGGGRRRL
jgi:hypothetical protein